MDKQLKFFREHKLAVVGIAIFGYIAVFVCFRVRSTVLFDIFVIVAGSLVLVTIYLWQPVKSGRAETRKSIRRRDRRHHRNGR